MQIENHTPFVVGQAVLLDKDGGEALIVALKATFRLGAGGEPVPAEKQEPLSFVDEFAGDPGASSIVREGELEPPKPATDVFLTGHAVAPSPGTREMEVVLRVGALSQHAVVSGRRVWERHLLGTKRSDPEPFDRVPLLWEHAFGGTDDSVDPAEWEPANPVGRGLFAKKTKGETVGAELPAIEHPVGRLEKPGQRVKPVGFGPVGRHWEPRRRFAGTYDQAWQEERAPLLPEDFDPRFFQAAAPGLISAGHLAGDERVEAIGVTPGGRLITVLPGLRPSCGVWIATRAEEPVLTLNTVHLDVDRMLLTLLYKGELWVHGEVLRLKRTTFEVPGGAA